MSRASMRLIVAAMALLALAGCTAAPVRLYLNPQADLTHYDKVAVVPFTNLTPQPLAADRVSRVFVTELILAGRYKVIEPAEFGGMLYRMGIEPSVQTGYDAASLARAADSLHVTGIIRGSVNEYDFQRIGQDEVPVLSFDVEMVDAATSDVVWRVSISRRGQGRLPLTGGSGTRSFGTLTQEACMEAVSELKKGAL
jgi:hypothetical protein